MGIEDLLRHVNRQEAGVEQETSGQEEVRDNGITSAAAEAFCSNCFSMPVIRPLQRIGGWLEISERSERSIWFQVSHMHFSYYLMIAALTLIGFEVIYALCQLAAFVL